MSVTLVKVGFTVTFKVTIESQPVTKLPKVVVCVPPTVNVNPFQEKGSSVSHTVVSVVLVNVGFTVTFKVAKLSQPDTALTKLDVCVPAAVNVNPFQEKGSSVSHTVVSVVLVKVLFTFKFNVAKLSQPVTKLVNVAVWLSMPLNVKPFHTYGS
jgi:hypothetical protein